jgi:hypothetical protein
VCLNGAVTSADKPRYLVIWTKTRSFGVFTVNSTGSQSSVAPNEVFGEKPNAVQATAPKEYIYRPRWKIASVTILIVAYDGSLELPPVYLAPGDLKLGALWSDSAKVLEAAVKYLSQEEDLSSTRR